MIGIFNRLALRGCDRYKSASRCITKKECSERYDQINEFEKMLTENGTVILKFLSPHLPRRAEAAADGTPQRRDQELEIPKGDLDDRGSGTISPRPTRLRSSTRARSWAPWYIVPADDNDIRDWLIARMIADALEKLDLNIPPRTRR